MTSPDIPSPDEARGMPVRPKSRAKQTAAAILGCVVTSAATVLLAVLIVAGTGGYLWLGRVGDDALQHADAVVVLAGAHDGRESYGLAVARQVSAAVLVLSNPYAADDPVMRRACAGSGQGITVICRRPAPATTRGEALAARQLATERHWQRIIVVSWRHHLPRARLVFSQCFADRPGVVIMRAVPRDEPMSLAEWEGTSLYQELAFLKARFQGSCGEPDHARGV